MITFPATIAYAFSPQYVKISGETSAKNVTVTIGGNSLQAALYNGAADIYVSRLLQLCFSDPYNERSKTVTITVSGDVSGSANVLVIWGSVSSEYKYGQFADNTGTRTVQYFKAYPFSVDILTASGFTEKYPSGSTTYSVNSPFGAIKTVVQERSEKEGIYLRWVDRFGFIQYYLFSIGDIESSPEVSDYKLQFERALQLGGYEANERPLRVVTGRKMKLCAVNLDRLTLDYVSSVVMSPIVDMYVDGTWVPVVISGGTYKYSRHHLVQLQDFEFDIELPVTKSQLL